MAADQTQSVFQMRVDASFTSKLDELRKAQDDLPTRSDMIRRLVEQAHAKIAAKSKR